MKIIRFSFYTIITIIFVMLCVVNRAPVSLSIFPLPYSFEVPLFLFAIGCVGFGVLITGLVMNAKMIKTYNLLRKNKKRIYAVENENKSLRSEREQSYTALPKQL